MVAINPNYRIPSDPAQAVNRRPSAEDIRTHAWLTERLAMLHYERHGLWPKLRRFFFGNRLVRWLALQR